MRQMPYIRLVGELRLLVANVEAMVPHLAKTYPAGFRQALETIQTVKDIPEYREDFDYEAECGYYECTECAQVWYPMEVDESPSECPGCLGELSRTEGG